MDLDPVLLARLQFAFTITFHIIFPSFTIGLSAFIATLLVRWAATGREQLHRLARFWTKIFAVSFAMGVVSGIVLSYQFGTNWSRFSVVVGNVIGPLIGYEVLMAFFLEATFLGIMLFGWNRVPPLAARALRHRRWRSAPRCRRSGSCPRTAGCRRRPVTRCATASPIRSTGSQMIFNPSFPYRFAHMLTAAYLTTSLVVLAVGARYLARRPASRGRPHHDAHGRRHAGYAGAAAAFHRRPARAQHARSTSRSRSRRWGRTGTAASRARFGAVRLARREGRDESVRDRDPEGGSLILTHDLNGLFPGLKSVPPADRPPVCRCSSPSASWSASAC